MAVHRWLHRTRSQVCGLCRMRHGFESAAFLSIPPSGFETPEDDPIRSDDAFLAEVEWAKGQAESCGCVCCHTTGTAPRRCGCFRYSGRRHLDGHLHQTGPRNCCRLDRFESLGAHAAMDNNGFDRSRTGSSNHRRRTHDPILRGRISQAWRDSEEFEGKQPLAAPSQRKQRLSPRHVPQGIGIDATNKISWSGGTARYIYVLEAGAANPGVPPNLDRPDGTIWKIDVEPTAAALKLGYSVRCCFQRRDASRTCRRYNTPTPRPAENIICMCCVISAHPSSAVCSPTQAMATSHRVEPPTHPGAPSVGMTWIAKCRRAYCVKMPGAPEGYCSIQCASNSVCTSNGAPADWTCNAVNCDVPQFTWCGPSAEIEESNGFLSVCRMRAD